MATGKRLVQLLHGKDIVQNFSSSDKNSKMSQAAKEIIAIAKQLTANGEPWHHHLLFPNCIFNKHQEKWTLVFEDPQTNQLLESISNQEPRKELKEIETLFYQK